MESENFDLIISNVNLIDGTGSPMQNNINIYIKDEKIEKIEKGKTGVGKIIIDGTGKYLIPNLFDCHRHTGDYNANLPKFTHYGVTSILVTGGQQMN